MGTTSLVEDPLLSETPVQPRAWLMATGHRCPSV